MHHETKRVHFSHQQNIFSSVYSDSKSLFSVFDLSFLSSSGQNRECLGRKAGTQKQRLQFEGGNGVVTTSPLNNKSFEAKVLLLHMKRWAWERRPHKGTRPPLISHFRAFYDWWYILELTFFFICRPFTDMLRVRKLPRKWAILTKSYATVSRFNIH